MAFTHTIPVLFGDCDAAKIVYYPRILHYCHVAMEALFEAAVGVPYGRIVTEQNLGYPTVRLEIEFQAPLRLGDVVEVAAVVERVGTRSVDFVWEGRRTDDGTLAFRCRSRSVAVTMDDFRSVDVPAPHRRGLERFMA